ncbi:MAG: hypothetical protein HWN65_05585 [Candidatus Helarchaeota archaeon]|nr:hypothetical protein [Candidatus Helarchaeota archaeon]
MLNELREKKIKWLIEEAKISSDEILQEHESCFANSNSEDEYNGCFDDKLNRLKKWKEAMHNETE